MFSLCICVHVCGSSYTICWETGWRKEKTRWGRLNIHHPFCCRARGLSRDAGRPKDAPLFYNSVRPKHVNSHCLLVFLCGVILHFSTSSSVQGLSTDNPPQHMSKCGTLLVYKCSQREPRCRHHGLLDSTEKEWDIAPWTPTRLWLPLLFTLPTVPEERLPAHITPL